jgi:heterodisulfide reductase subunit C
MEFSERVTRHIGGETLTSCYQCGTCVSSCPIAKITPEFNPREIIKLALLGLREEVVSGDKIWLCTSCYNCNERCPQKVEIAEIIYAMRNMAFEASNKPAIYDEFVSAFKEKGRVVPISQFVEKKRADYGLPPLQPTGVEALQKILSALKFGEASSKEGEDE